MAAFVNEMVEHCKGFSPRLCGVLGDEQLHLVVRASLETARGYGMTHRGPVRSYIELVFLFGSDFATDPQYPWVLEILAGEKYPTQMQKATKLYQRTRAYQEKVAGPKDACTHAALIRMRAMAEHRLPVSQAQFRVDMSKLIHSIYPEKAAYVGTEGLAGIIDEAQAMAASHEMSGVRAWTLLATLMFAFGHGCTADPLYPWIERTLTDTRIQDGAQRAKRLEKKAMTWLDSVLSAYDQGVGE